MKTKYFYLLAAVLLLVLPVTHAQTVVTTDASMMRKDN